MLTLSNARRTKIDNRLGSSRQKGIDYAMALPKPRVKTVANFTFRTSFNDRSYGCMTPG